MDKASAHIFQYGLTLALPAALPFSAGRLPVGRPDAGRRRGDRLRLPLGDRAEIPARSARHRAAVRPARLDRGPGHRSEEHTSELQSLMRITYAAFCFNKKKRTQL